MHTILVVEDEKKIAQSIESHLHRAGFAALLAHDAFEAMNVIRRSPPALIVLDLNLPQKSGLELLSDLRLHNVEIPVLILSAWDKVEDKVRGLQLGADDYLTKPFDSSELLVRIETILRRSGKQSQNELRADNLTLNIVSRTVTRGGTTIALPPKQLALLEFLLRNKGQLLSRRRIAEQVWGYKFDTGTNLVDVQINNLRKAINLSGSKRLIQTIHGEGYILRDD